MKRDHLDHEDAETFAAVDEGLCDVGRSRCFRGRSSGVSEEMDFGGRKKQEKPAPRRPLTAGQAGAQQCCAPT